MNQRGQGALHVTYPALLGALALAVLYLASAAPSGRWGLTAMAGLFPAAAVISVGLKAGFLCWGGVSLLAWLLLPDKLIAMLFSVLFGLYPVVKAVFERRKSKALAWVLKLLFFNAAFTAVFLAMSALVLADMPEFMQSTWMLYAAGNAVFILYDIGLSKLIGFYIVRIDRAVRGRGRHSS